MRPTRALAACDAEALAQVMAQVVLKAREVEKRVEKEQIETVRQVAVDGKTLRGTQGHESAHQPTVHVLSWYEPQTGLVLAWSTGDAKLRGVWHKSGASEKRH